MTKFWTFLVTATLLALFAPMPIARADIFRWEYINPSNPSLGKQPSTRLTPGGAGVDAAAGANLSSRNLTMAYLIGANLIGAHAHDTNLTNAELSQANLTNANFTAYFYYTDLTGANLTQANLTNANFWNVTLSGANLTGTEVRGANFDNVIGTGITMSQLYSTASYQAHDLAEIGLNYCNLAGVNLAGQNLTNVSLLHATLINADFSHANLTDANFIYATLTNAHLNHANLTNANFAGYTYPVYDEIGGEYLVVAPGANLTNAILSGVDARGTHFQYASLYGANLSQANLTNADFSGFDGCYAVGCYSAPGADLSGANLSGADARGANFHLATLSGANTSNLIQFYGHILGLDLTAGASLVVRDYDGNPAASPPTCPLPIVVEQHLALDATGTLRLVFDADPWNSTIFFAPGIPVTRGGALELTFASDVNLASQVGRTIDLFDWTGVNPTGAFTISSPYTWNLSNLYTTGEVTLTALAAIPGDFNNNGVVDAADYIAWRKTDGTQSGYNAWRTHFGQPTGSGTGDRTNAVVPEPTTTVMVMFAATVWRLLRRRAK